VHIPLGLNLKVFRPIDKAAARLVFDLGSEEKVLLFVAASLSVRRKGADLLVKALGHLRASGSGAVRLMIVGAGGEAMQRLAAYPVLDLGEIRDDLLMVAAYSAADVFVLPTRADNLPLVLLESLACGTPCVSFRVGGVPDVVRPGQTGWLAEPDDARDLARCLHEALASDEKRREMSAACRRVAEEEYDVRLMAERYVRLYEELIEEHRRT
jgi:glycosyltransferase involved in cell wall biosynthesis